MLLGFVVAPLALKVAAPRVVDSTVAGGLRLGWVWMNPLTFSVTLRGLELSDAEGAPVLSAERLHANADPVASLFTGELRAAEVSLRGLALNIVVAEDGTLNIAEALTPLEPAPPRTDPPEPFDIPAAVLRRFAIEDARIHFEDRSMPKPFARTITALNLALDDIRTSAEHENLYEFTAVTGANERVRVAGVFRLDPLSLSGSVEIDGVRLPDYGPFYAEAAGVELTDGQAAGGFEYVFAPLGEERRLGLANGRFELDEVEMRIPGSEGPFFRLERLALSGMEVDLFAHRAALKSFTIDGGFLRAQRDDDGTIDLLALVPEAEDGPPPQHDAAPARGPGEPLEFGVRADGEDMAAPVNAVLEHLAELAESDWSVALAHFDFRNFALELEDRMTPEPTLLRFHEIALGITDLSNARGSSAAMDFSMRINDEGSISVNGSLIPDPVEADLEYSVTALDLRPFGAVAETFVPVRLDSAVVASSGSLRASLGPDGEPEVEYGGDTAISGFSVRLSGDGHPLATFDALNITDTRLTTEPLALTVAEVFLDTPSARIERLEDGSLAVMRVLPETAEDAEDVDAPDEGDLDLDPEAVPPAVAVADEDVPAAEQLTVPEPPLDIRVGEFRIQDGRAEFHDAAVQPRARLLLSSVQLSVRDIALDEDTTTSVDFSALFAERGRLSAEGTLSLADPATRTAVTAAIADLPLAVFSPYAADAVGRPIRQGEFSGDFRVRVDANALESTNQLRVQSIRFGDAIRSGAPPVGVAVAALENSDGLISLDIPVRGQLDDPDFQPARLVIGILRTTVLRALTAPLSIAGSMIGGSIPGLSILRAAEDGEDDLSLVAFAAGESRLDQRARDRLDTLAAFLRDRPQAVLQLRPSVDPEADRRSAARAALDARLAEIDAPSRSQAIRALYAEYFGPPAQAAVDGGEAARELEAAREEQSETEDPAPGFYLRGREERAPGTGRFYKAPGTERREAGRGFYRDTPPPRPARDRPRTPDAEPAEPSAATPGIAEMRERLLEEFSPDEDFMGKLASARLESVRGHLVDEAGLSAQRLRLPTADEHPAREGAHVRFAFATELE